MQNHSELSEKTAIINISEQYMPEVLPREVICLQVMFATKLRLNIAKFVVRQQANIESCPNQSYFTLTIVYFSKVYMI